MATFVLIQNFYSKPPPVQYYKYLVYKVLFLQIASMIGLFCLPIAFDKFPSDMILVPLYINAATIAKYLILMVGKIKLSDITISTVNDQEVENNPFQTLVFLSVAIDVALWFYLLAAGHIDPDYGTEGLTPDTATVGMISCTCSLYLSYKLMESGNN